MPEGSDCGDVLHEMFSLFCYHYQKEQVRDPKVLFFSNSEFNETAAGEYFVIIEYNGTITGAEVAKEDTTVEYLFAAYTSECLYWNTITNTWIGDGCAVRHPFFSKRSDKFLNFHLE